MQLLTIAQACAILTFSQSVLAGSSTQPYFAAIAAKARGKIDLSEYALGEHVNIQTDVSSGISLVLVTSSTKNTVNLDEPDIKEKLKKAASLGANGGVSEPGVGTFMFVKADGTSSPGGTGLKAYIPGSKNNKRHRGIRARGHAHAHDHDGSGSSHGNHNNFKSHHVHHPATSTLTPEVASTTVPASTTTSCV